LALIAATVIVSCTPEEKESTPVVGLKLNAASHTFTSVDGTLELIAAVQPTYADNKKVTWSVEPADGVVTVTPNADKPVRAEVKVVPSVKFGEPIKATVKAISEEGGLIAKCEFTVNIPIVVEGVSLDRENFEITIGDDPVTLVASVLPADATNKNVTWSVEPAEGVVTVVDGVVTPVGVGTATITVTTEDGAMTDVCDVTVLPAAVEEVTLPATAEVDEGATITLTPVFVPEYATNQNVTWSVAPEGIVTVVDGVVKGIDVGSATVTVTTEDGGKTASCVVTVNVNPNVIFLAGTTPGGRSWVWDADIEGGVVYGSGGYGYSVTPDWGGIGIGGTSPGVDTVYADGKITFFIDGTVTVVDNGGTTSGTFSFDPSAATAGYSVGSVTFTGVKIPTPRTYWGAVIDPHTFELCKTNDNHLFLSWVEAGAVFQDPNWSTSSYLWMFQAE
jgi:uncharacterized protein YjdB